MIDFTTEIACDIENAGSLEDVLYMISDRNDSEIAQAIADYCISAQEENIKTHLCEDDYQEVDELFNKSAFNVHFDVLIDERNCQDKELNGRIIMNKHKAFALFTASFKRCLFKQGFKFHNGIY